MGSSEDERRRQASTPAPRTRYGVGDASTPGAHAARGLPVATPRSFGSANTTPMAAPIDLQPGGHIQQYELIRELGRGGMGVVWAARDTVLGRRVAIKFLLDASRAVAERFLVEARATAQCNHDNIVIIYEVNELGGMPYMALELLEGQPLRELIGELGTAGNRIAPSRVVELMLPVARALARAHDLGIVHRDLKPENIFVTSAGQVKVLDFGIAKAVATRDTAQRPAPIGHDIGALGVTNLTGAGALVGTLPYMSPEQLRAGHVDHRADIWAAGIIMFEMLAGWHPIAAASTEDLFGHVLSDGPMMSVIDSVPDVPDPLAAVVDHCLRKHANERPSAAELVHRLEGLLPGRAGRPLAEGESPYPGLTAFQESDADRFFGRPREIARMTARIRELPITGIVGPSGVGKSSFMRAGVGPALKASGEHWEVVTLRPGRAPLSALASLVQRLTTRSGTSIERQTSEHRELVQRLRAEPGFVGTLLRARTRHTGGQILLFVDQFEELYTLVPDVAERRAFTAALAGVADDTAAPLRIVVSMRSDFLDRVAEDERFMAELSRGLVFLQPPDRDGLREALVAPVEMVGHSFESAEMVEHMVDALVDTPGALPLLQFAAAKLWDARDRQRRLLTVASYRAIGGISGALATHADDVVARMNDRAKKLTQQIFRRLVTPERTRAIAELADLEALSGNAAEVKRTIDQLVDARLLVVQTRGDASGGSVELVHESLIDRWPTLRRWLDEDQEDAAFLSQLTAAAKQWETKQRAAGLLWRGEAIEEARRWHGHRPRELPAREQAFLDAGFALARRGKRARGALLVVTFVLLAAVAAGAMVAFVWIRGAEQKASENAQRAVAGERAAKQALEQMQVKERERLAAEEKQLVAEAEKHKVEAEKQKAEAAKVKAEAAVAESAEELKKKNQELERKADALATALKDASSAKDRAERSAKEAKDAKAGLQSANARLKAENERLQKEVLSSKLK